MRNRAGIQTSRKILTATRELLSERGLDGATVKAICDRADVRPGSFYNLFDSKEQVVFAVLGEAIRAVDPDPDRTGDETAADLVDAFVRFVISDETLARVYMAIAVTGSLTDPRIRDRIARHHHDRVVRFADALSDSDLDPEVVGEAAEALVAALNGYAIQALLDPGFDFPSHARHLLSFAPVIQSAADTS